jgi:hypothetical protein
MELALECRHMVVVDGQLLIKDADGWVLETGDRSVFVTEEFLNRCSPEKAELIRTKVASL